MEWFPALRKRLAARGVHLPDPYPYTARTFKGSVLALSLIHILYATEINEAMKLAAARALAALAKEPVPAEVSAAYQGQTFSFGQGYVIPKPFDPRLIEWLPPAVAQAAMDTGVTRKPIEDMDAYKASLRVRIQKAQGRANALIESYK